MQYLRNQKELWHDFGVIRLLEIQLSNDIKTTRIGCVFPEKSSKTYKSFETSHDPHTTTRGTQQLFCRKQLNTLVLFLVEHESLHISVLEPTQNMHSTTVSTIDCGLLCAGSTPGSAAKFLHLFYLH